MNEVFEELLDTQQWARFARQQLEAGEHISREQLGILFGWIEQGIQAALDKLPVEEETE